MIPFGCIRASKSLCFETGEFVIGPVGFTAYASVPADYGAFETIIFDAVVTNYGSAYDSDSGIFTCPVRGDAWFAFRLGFREFKSHGHRYIFR